MDRLTEKSFWNDYWEGIQLPVLVNMNFINDKLIAECLLTHIPNGENIKTALEIGCAPGKWMLFLCNSLNYKVTGIEYLNIAVKKTRENIKSNKNSNSVCDVFECDFFEYKNHNYYDLVVSFGFVEHFNDIEHILSKQVVLLKAGGYLVIGIPNFKGVNYFFQKLIDFFQKEKTLFKHNIKAMDLSFYKLFASKNNLSVIFSNYLGAFEPACFYVDQIKNKYIRFMLKLIRRILSLSLKKTSGKFFSGYMMIILQKNYEK